MTGRPKKPTAETVIDGRLVRAWSRRNEIEVDVYAGETAEGDPVGEWGMPKLVGLHGAMRQAAAQTPKTETPDRSTP